MTLRKEQPLSRPQNYFRSVHSRRPRRQEDPLDVRVAKKTLSEVPGPDEPLTLGSSSLEGSSSSTRAETILPAFGIRMKAFRVVLGSASLEEATPHLFVHGIQQHLRFLVLDFSNLHQLRHNLLSGLEGPLVAILLIRVTWTRWR